MRKNKSLFVWLTAVVTSVLLRLFTMIIMTEYETGFIKSGYFVASGILFAVFLIITAFAAAYISVSAAGANTSNTFSLTNSVFSLAVGVTIAINTFSCDYASIPAAIKVLCTLLGILSAVFFLGFAFRAVFHFPFSGKLTAIPLLYLIIKSAVVFIRSAYYTVINDTLFEVGSYCLLMLVFLEIARVANGFINSDNTKKFALLAVAASIFLISTSLPKLIIAAVYPSALHDGAGDSILLFFLGLFVSSLAFSRISFVEKDDRKMGVYYVGKH